MPYSEIAYHMPWIPLTIGRLKKIQWIPLIEKVQERMASWKEKMFSLGGRVLMNEIVSQCSQPSPILPFLLPAFKMDGKGE